MELIFRFYNILFLLNILYYKQEMFLKAGKTETENGIRLFLLKEIISVEF